MARSALEPSTLAFKSEALGRLLHDCLRHTSLRAECGDSGYVESSKGRGSPCGFQNNNYSTERNGKMTRAKYEICGEAL
eukprot:6178358-Pleurochrysis_carterae.AAC.1